jgi:hypothetical protein
MKKLFIILCLLLLCFIPANAGVITVVNNSSMAVTGGENDYTTGLWAYWNLDDATTPFVDLYSSNDLTNHGAADVSGGQDFVHSEKDFANVSATTLDEDLAISVFMRVNLDATNSNYRLFHFKDDNTGFLIIADGTTLLAVPADNDGSTSTWGDPANAIVSGTVSTGTKINIVAVFSSGTGAKSVTRLYVNGTALTTTSSLGYGNGVDGDEIYIMALRSGVDTPSLTADGIVEIVAVWNRELSADECVDLNTNYTYTEW